MLTHWTSNRLVLLLNSYLLIHRNSQENKQYSLVYWLVLYIPIIHIFNFQLFLLSLSGWYSKNSSPVPPSISGILSTTQLSCNVTSNSSSKYYSTLRMLCNVITRGPNSYLKILGARRVTRSNFHMEYPQILGATVPNLFTWVTLQLGFVHPRS
jgi:hypothetical protein